MLLGELAWPRLLVVIVMAKSTDALANQRANGEGGEKGGEGAAVAEVAVQLGRPLAGPSRSIYGVIVRIQVVGSHAACIGTLIVHEESPMECIIEGESGGGGAEEGGPHHLRSQAPQRPSILSVLYEP